MVPRAVRHGGLTSLQRAWVEEGSRAAACGGGVHRARDRSHYRPRQPERGRTLYQGCGSTEAGNSGDGENRNACWPTSCKVSQKTQKAVRTQSGFMCRTNWSGLHDRCELGRAIGSQHLAQRDQSRCDDAIERSLDFRVAEVERGLCGIDLCLLEPSPRGVAIGRCVIERLFRGDVPARELGLPLVFQFSLFPRGLGAGLGSPRLLELEPVWLGLDDEERRPLLHLLAILVVDLLQEALHSRDQVGSADCGRVAGGLEVACDLLLHRNRHGDLRRRRRHVAIFLPTGGKHHRKRACCEASGKRRTARRRSTDHCTTLTKLEVTILDSKVEVSKHNRRPKAPAVPFPRVSLAQELVLSTVTARRFCDQQEISLHTATGRSLP